jgi:hypothetical protein
VKKKDVLDLTTKAPLIERQRRLWAHSEAIEIAQQEQKPLPTNESEWLHRALKNIACGMDANEVFNVLPEKQGVRKDGFKKELERKMRNSFIAAASEKGDGEKTISKAIDEISKAMPAAKKSTVRKEFNKVSTNRKPTYSMGKK